MLREVVEADVTSSTPRSSDADRTVTVSSHHVTTDVTGVSTVAWDTPRRQTVVPGLSATIIIIII